MAGRHPGQREPWARLGVVWLSDVARTGRRARVRKSGLTVSTGSSENPAANPPSTAHRVRVIIFRVVAALAGLFFVVAVVLMASRALVGVAA
jgi:hypothetical protein